MEKSIKKEKFSLDFINMVEQVILFETGGREDGAYTNDPNDLGKETKWGISKKSNPNYDIKKLTKTVAERIYHYTYYSLYFEKFLDKKLAFKVFDMGVLTGKTRSIKKLQEAVNKCGIKLKVDGKIGPVTTAAVNSLYNSLKGDKLYNEFIYKYKIYFNLICVIRPKNLKYRKGWLNRLSYKYSLPVIATKTTKEVTHG